MRRDVDINEISDGRRYKSSDMVKVGCSDCRGCSECCRQVDDTIILDPYDIWQFKKGLNLTFDEMLAENTEPVIELGLADGLLLPHLKINTTAGACSFLGSDGRCTIHAFRPGFCRLYPLGRIYENGGFSYFIQINECPYQGKTKVKIKKWLGINDLPSYEAFVLKWHDILEEKRNGLTAITDQSERSRYIVDFLKRFYQDPYDEARPFYEQFNERV
ncbi:MAG: YkgJ family cysteine cluster protein [Lachnospiraceae bacterium]|nr:YkgJ family cysteine cluster protein [Lachnospiraceae bacterium]MBR6486353.1 YkgJ family cysteine cluster protein [Lachnospiraceae bacterium]